MADKPLVLTRPNVCAVLERRKRMTRRIINPQPIKGRNEELNKDVWHWGKYTWAEDGISPNVLSITYEGRFQVGDRAYVAEGYQIAESTLNWVQGNYLADDKEFKVVLTSKEHNLFIDRKFPYRKTPGRFMYKSLARIFLPIVEVRVERLQDITPADCEAEGIQGIHCNSGVGGHMHHDTIYPAFRDKPGGFHTAKDAFEQVWLSIHGEDAWDRNDWVFVYRWDEIITKGE